MQPPDDRRGEQPQPEQGGSALDQLGQVLRRAGELVRSLSAYFGEGEEGTGSAPDDIKSAFGHVQWRRVAKLLALAAFVAYMGSGLYVVNPGEVGVVQTFGALTSDKLPEGLRWHIPWPVQKVNKVNVKLVRREGIGVDIPQHKPPICPPGKEFHAVTGDENIISLKLIAQYSVQDAGDYLFALNFEPYGIVRNAVKYAATAVVGQMAVDDILTGKKIEAQNRIRRDAQQLLDAYRSGLAIVSINFEEVSPPEDVRDAFKEVASAKEEAKKKINDAEAYSNSLLAQARGEAGKIVSDGEGYASEVVKQAEGDADRFSQTLAEYRKNVRIYSEDVTRQRYFLETMERIMPRVKKYIVGTGSGRVNLRFFESGSGTSRTQTMSPPGAPSPGSSWPGVPGGPPSGGPPPQPPAMGP